MLDGKAGGLSQASCAAVSGRKEVDGRIKFRRFPRSQVERSLQVPVVASLGGVFVGPGALGEGAVRWNGTAVSLEAGFVLL